MTGLQEPGSEQLPKHHAHSCLNFYRNVALQDILRMLHFHIKHRIQEIIFKTNKKIHFLFPPMDWTEICPDKIRLMTTPVFNLRYPLVTVFVTQNNIWKTDF